MPRRTKLTTTRTNPIICHKCKQPLDAHTHIGAKPARPKPDDVGTCIYCKTLFKFTPTGGGVPLTPKETFEVVTSDEYDRVHKAVDYINASIRINPRPNE